MKRGDFRIATWHGEGRTLFYVIGWSEEWPEGEIYGTFPTREAAQRYVNPNPGICPSKAICPKS